MEPKNLKSAYPIEQIHLDEQQSYYDSRAEEYDDWWYRRGVFDQGELLNGIWNTEVEIVRSALKSAPLRGDVLELAAGTGIWSELFLQAADTLTVVDGSAQMLSRNPMIINPRVKVIQTDLFSWQPDRKFDAIGFTFWISHIPRERVREFLCEICNWLNPGGRVFFMDNRQKPEANLPHVIDQNGQLMRRRLQDGSEATIIKNYYDKNEMEALCRSAGIEAMVMETPNHFQYVFGLRANSA